MVQNTEGAEPWQEDRPLEESCWQEATEEEEQVLKLKIGSEAETDSLKEEPAKEVAEGHSSSEEGMFEWKLVEAGLKQEREECCSKRVSGRFE